MRNKKPSIAARLIKANSLCDAEYLTVYGQAA
jgi:hypothetical protein